MITLLALKLKHLKPALKILARISRSKLTVPGLARTVSSKPR